MSWGNCGTSRQQEISLDYPDDPFDVPSHWDVRKGENTPPLPLHVHYYVLDDGEKHPEHWSMRS